MTPHAEKVSKFTRQLYDTRLSLQDWVYKIESTRLRIILLKISTKRCQKISAKYKGFFAENKWKSANMRSSTVQLHGVDLIDIQIQNWL